jgi:hypothetical protein
MRDKRFIALHRGGSLSKHHHYQLVLWACGCVENVLSFFEESDWKQQILAAFVVVKDWTVSNTTVGAARNAAFQMIALAKEVTDPVQKALARAAGHAVATAHMADHSLRAAEYVLKATQWTGNAVAEERAFQDTILPAEIRELVLTARRMGTKKDLF